MSKVGVGVKNCPRCGLINPGDSLTCDCRYDFDHIGLQPQVTSSDIPELRERMAPWKRVLLTAALVLLVRFISVATRLNHSIEGEILSWGLVVAVVVTSIVLSRRSGMSEDQ